MQPGIRQLTVAEHSHGHPAAQETNLFREFTRQVRSGRLNMDWPDYAFKTQALMEACLNAARRERS
jgi:hypothetical protein